MIHTLSSLLVNNIVWFLALFSHYVLSYLILCVNYVLLFYLPLLSFSNKTSLEHSKVNILQ